MRAIAAILESDDIRKHVRVEYVGRDGVTTRYCECDDHGNPVGQWKNQKRIGISLRAEELVQFLQGDNWDAGTRLIAINILDALG